MEHDFLVLNGRLVERHNKVFCHLRAPHTSIILHTDGKRMESGLQRLDIDDFRLLLLRHPCLNLSVNPVLMLLDCLVSNAGGGKRNDEILGYLRAPHPSIILHTNGK